MISNMLVNSVNTRCNSPFTRQGSQVQSLYHPPETSGKRRCDEEQKAAFWRLFCFLPSARAKSPISASPVDALCGLRLVPRFSPFVIIPLPAPCRLSVFPTTVSFGLPKPSLPRRALPSVPRALHWPSFSRSFLLDMPATPLWRSSHKAGQGGRSLAPTKPQPVP